jgi:hypothetical protein
MSIPLELLLQANVSGFKSGMGQAKKEVKTYAKETKKAVGNNDLLSRSFLSAGNNASIFYGPLNGVSGRLTSIGVGLRALPGPVLVATTALTSLAIAISKSVNQSQQWEMQELMLSKQLELTGYNAGKTAEQLTAQAKAQGKNTLGNVESARAAQGILLGFDSIQGKVFDRTMAIAQDIVQVYGGDLSSAVNKVAKALEEPASKLEALIRVGASFTEQQQKEIAAWQEQGQSAKAHEAILSNLERRLGGTAIEAAKGYAGTLDTLGHNTELFFEAVGKATGAADGVNAFVSALNAGIDVINQDLNPDRKNRMSELRDDIKTYQSELGELPSYLDQNMFQRGTWFNLSRDLTTAQKEFDKLFAVETAAREKTFLANQSAAKKLAARDKKNASDHLKSQQESGLTTLRSLESNLKLETQKIANDHSKRLADVNKLVLTEKEIKARGFDDINTLKDSYVVLANAKHDSELADFKKRGEQEIKASRDKFARIAAMQAKAKESAAKLAGKIGGKDSTAEFKYKSDLNALIGFRQKELYTEAEFEKLKTQLADNYAKTRRNIRLGINPDSSEYQDKLADFEISLLGEENALKASYARRLQELDNLKLKEQGLDTKYKELKAGVDLEYKEKKTKADLEQHGEYGKMVGGFVGWEKKTQSDKAKSLIGMGAMVGGALAGQSKKAFKVKKAMMIAEATMSTYQMAVNSYNALAGIPIVGPVLGAIAAAGAIAYGIGQVNTIRAQQPSQFHRGIDYVPTDLGNVSLTKGERVLAPRLNKDLTGYLDNKKTSDSQGGGTTVYMTNKIQALDGASVKQILMQQGKTISNAISRYERRT